MVPYSIELRARKYVKRFGSYADALKTVTKKVAHKAAKATGEVIGNRIANKIVEPKPVSDVNLRNVAEVSIPLEKREEIWNELRQKKKQQKTILNFSVDSVNVIE